MTERKLGIEIDGIVRAVFWRISPIIVEQKSVYNIETGEVSDTVSFPLLRLYNGGTDDDYFHEWCLNCSATYQEIGEHEVDMFRSISVVGPGGCWDAVDAACCKYQWLRNDDNDEFKIGMALFIYDHGIWRDRK